jgi:hypothetical protein
MPQLRQCDCIIAIFGAVSSIASLLTEHVSPVVLFDTASNGQQRKAIAEAGRPGWVYILDANNG